MHQSLPSKAEIMSFQSQTQVDTHTGGQGRVPEVGQPVLPGLGVEVRDDLELSVLHSLTSSEVQSALNVSLLGVDSSVQPTWIAL